MEEREGDEEGLHKYELVLSREQVEEDILSIEETHISMKLFRLCLHSMCVGSSLKQKR